MNTKQQTLFWMFGVVMVTLACAVVSGSPVPPATQPPPQVNDVATAVAATLQSMTAIPVENIPTQAEIPTQISGIPVSAGPVSFVIPTGLAGRANPQTVPAVGQDGGAPWDVAPEHWKFSLEGYQLQNKFHEPAIYVYPTSEYAAAHPGAAEQIKRLESALTGAPLMEETLPIVPFFNAGPLFAAKIELIKFQNGIGVRALTQYAQYSGPINNRELFYHFEGLTSDNRYYIIAILPITAPVLAEDDTPGAAVPPDGVPFPADLEPGQVYYFSIAEKLNALTSESFIPSINMLDLLIQSVLVTST